MVDTESPRKVFDRIYEHPKKVFAVPVAIFLLSIGVLTYSYVTTGQTIGKGIDFTGGTEIHVPVGADVSPSEVEDVFGEGASARTMTASDARWIIVETQAEYEKEGVVKMLNDAGIPFDEKEASVRGLGEAVGAAFFQEAQMWAGVALLIMSAVIFIAFRSFVPSMAVIFAAVTDILAALAGMSLLGIDLTLGSLAALLMLLGYSVDTDILLSTRVLKQRKGDLKDRIWSSIVTGSTMSIAAISAFLALYLVSPAAVLKQLSAAIILGLSADLPLTWLGNAFILKWYVERGG